jgi:hypothetical protein
MHRVATAVSVMLAAFLLPRLAHANGTEIAVDADGAVPVNTRLLSGGGGFGLRLGEEIHFPLLRLTPEIGYGYMHLFARDAPSDWTTHRVVGGLRLGLGELLVPFVFVHAGYGWRATPDNSYGGDGLAVDAGAGLDVNLGFISLGGHAGYATIGAQPSSPQWVILGLDAALVL